ncbi:hypothetical protein L6164_034912 [Bauhinia variegata]|uniref:Uncharacterized protein n=1 Tax=Bauhinia variegata TaxID=167791 RepID=A0ACB9KWZ9_BAUVA|nr:hypothetical protein L6164_034912 [Bauhinia variegata]
MKAVAAPNPDLASRFRPLDALSYRDCMELFDLDDAVRSWSAVISYQQFCDDALLQTNSYSLQMPIRLTRMTLAIVDGFPDNRHAAVFHASRRLLAAAELGNYPTWLLHTQEQS